MALSEIEKLERRYAENPQGLTFAPLAEVHRKNGEVQRALDLLGPGLAIHPNYIPARIVLGRCHLDLGEVQTAEQAFLHVLALDGENVIALKALADISERLLKLDDAERWLHTLLSVDRSNDEAREQLQRVEIARRQAEAGSAAEPASAQVTPVAGEGEPAPAGDTTVTESTPEPAPGFEPPVAEPATLREPFDEPVVMHPEEPAGLQVEEPAGLGVEEPAGLQVDESTGLQVDEPTGLQVDEPVRDEEEIRPLEGLVGREVDLPDETAGEFRVETSEDIVLRSSGGNEFQVPDASQELFAEGGVRERAPFEPFEEDAPLPREPAATPEHGPEPMIVGWGERIEEPARDPEPQPTAAAGPDPALATSEPELSVPQRAAPKRAYAAGETGGRPVAQLLKDILSARPPAHSAPSPVRQAPGAGGSGAPTRPAADALSLSSVFGEEEAPGTPPAVPAAGSATGVSYDDFFGAPGATPTQRGTRTPDPRNDDLDQFHAWLQNLKR